MVKKTPKAKAVMAAAVVARTPSVKGLLRLRRWFFLSAVLLASTTVLAAIDVTPETMKEVLSGTFVQGAVNTHSDLSISMLGEMFGTVSGVFFGTGTSLLAQMFLIFNLGVLIMVGGMLAVTTTISVVNTSREGNFMGQRMVSHQVLVRSVAGAAMLVPKFNGFSFLQVIIFWVATMGCHLANATWENASELTRMATTELDRSLHGLKHEQGSQNTVLNIAAIEKALEHVVKPLIKSELCMAKQQADATLACEGLENCTPDKIAYSDNYKENEAVPTSFLAEYGSSQKLDDDKAINACGKITISTQGQDTAWGKRMQGSKVRAFKHIQQQVREKAASSFTNSSSEPKLPLDQKSWSVLASNLAYEYLTVAPPIRQGNIIRGTARVVDARRKLSGSSSSKASSLEAMDGGWMTAGFNYHRLIPQSKIPRETIDDVEYFNASAVAGEAAVSININDYGDGGYDEYWDSDKYWHVTVVKESQDYTGVVSTVDAFVDQSFGLAKQVMEDAEKQQLEAMKIKKLDGQSTADVDALVDRIQRAAFYVMPKIHLKDNNSEEGQEEPLKARHILQTGRHNSNYEDMSASIRQSLDESRAREKMTLADAACATMLLNIFLNCDEYTEKDNPSINIFKWTNTATLGIGMANSYFEEYSIWFYQDIQVFIYKVVYAWLDTVLKPMYGEKDIGNFSAKSHGLLQNMFRDPVSRISYMGQRIFSASIEFWYVALRDLIAHLYQRAQYYSRQMQIMMSMMQMYTFLGKGLIFVGKQALKIPIVGWIIGMILILLGIFVGGLGGAWMATAQAQRLLFRLEVFKQLMYIPMVAVAALPIMVLGFLLAFYVAFIPTVLYTLVLIGWFILLIEALVAAPLIALGVTHPEGHQILGKAEQALNLLVSVFIRPVTILIGFLAAVVLSFPAMWVFDFMFNSVTLQMMRGMDWAMADPSLLGQYLFVLMTLVVYSYAAMDVLSHVFGLCYRVPDNIMKWLGVQPPQSEIPGMMRDLKMGMGESAKQAGEGGVGETRSAPGRFGPVG